MKASILVSELHEALVLCAHSVATRSTLPILYNFKLEALADGRLLVQACNLETSTTAWLPAKVDEVGATTVPAKTLGDLLSAMQDERADLELNVKTNTLNIKCGRFDNNVRGIEAGEFPLAPTAFDDWSSISVPAAPLGEWIKRGTYATATDESRPILTGALLSLKGGDMTLASSDGFRLAVQIAKVDETPDARVIVPARVLEIARLIIGLDEDNSPLVQVCIAPGKNQIAFHVPNAQVIGQLIDGNFPDYNQIIPKSHKTRAVVGVAELRRALKAAEVFARESSNIVKFDFGPGSESKPGSITVSAVSSETGDGTSDLDSTVEGEPLVIAFNVKYFLEALNHLGTAQAEILASESGAPALVKPVGDNGHLAVVMPMNLTR